MASHDYLTSDSSETSIHLLYLSNYLASNSVTLSSYVRPTSIIIVVIIAMFFKDKERRPSLKQIIGIIFVVIGIFLINK